MNNDTEGYKIPELIGDLLTDKNSHPDNMVADLWKELTIGQLIKRSGFTKRSGLPIEQVIYLLIIWVWLKADSIGMFAHDMMRSFGCRNKDVLYDQMKREDLDWRTLHYQTVRKVIIKEKIHQAPIRAFVVDDSVKVRKGKKLEAVSRHFDHLLGRTVKGQQVLTLGLATEEHFLVLDNDIFMSQSQRQGLKDPFKDGRSIVGKRYQATASQSKPELLSAMVKRAVRNHIDADYFLADAWFGNKPTIRLAHEVNSVPVLRMKNDKTLYRYYTIKEGRKIYQDYNAQQLHQKVIRKHWKTCTNTPYQTVSVNVELNLAKSDKEPAHWVNVQLLYVRGAAKEEKPTVGKKDWALFLTTDLALSPQKILEIYALRWGIEVYFKEAKQYLGWLKEQTETFASHIASLHLCAIRYAMLVYAKAQNNNRVCDMRRDLEEQLTLLSYGQKLWGLFRFLIQISLNEIQEELRDQVKLIMDTLDKNIVNFFTQALQLDQRTLNLEAR